MDFKEKGMRSHVNLCFRNTTFDCGMEKILEKRSILQLIQLEEGDNTRNKGAMIKQACCTGRT